MARTVAARGGDPGRCVSPGGTCGPRQLCTAAWSSAGQQPRPSSSSTPTPTSTSSTSMAPDDDYDEDGQWELLKHSSVPGYASVVDSRHQA